MPRIDDYQQALELGRKELSDKSPDLLAGYAGGVMKKDEQGDLTLSLNLLNQDISSPWPELNFSKADSGEELPIQQQVLLAHYLVGVWNARGRALTGEWIAFQDVPDGRFYLDAFMKRAKVPLVSAFGQNPELLQELTARVYGATALDHGDVGMEVRALPLVPVALIIWEGDDEFPPEGNLLFDQNIISIFSAEDIAWLAGMVVYPLIGMANA
jgi:hypothetical protein